MDERHIGYIVDEQELLLMTDVFYEARGVLVPAIVGCDDMEKKRSLRKREHKLRRLMDRAEKCIGILRKRE